MYTTSEANSELHHRRATRQLAGEYGFEILETAGISTICGYTHLAADDSDFSKVDCMTNLTDNTVVAVPAHDPGEGK